jgi:hypothetical protein
LVEVGPKSMAAFTATPPRRKPQEDKHLTDLDAENARLKGQKGDLEQQLERAKRESDARAKQQETMIGKFTAQLEV